MDALQQRYNKAKKDNHKSFRYSLRLRIAVVDGMRNMYYDYAHKKAEVVAELRQELFGEVVDIVSDETDVEMYWINTEDPQNFYNGSFQSHTLFSKRVWIVIA